MGYRVRWKEFNIEGIVIFALSSDDKSLLQIHFDNGLVKILSANELEPIKDSNGMYIRVPKDPTNTCIVCNSICPEGRQICINCESDIF